MSRKGILFVISAPSGSGKTSLSDALCTDMDSVVRSDEITESSPVDDVLLNAPATEDDFVRVRAVLDG